MKILIVSLFIIGMILFIIYSLSQYEKKSEEEKKLEDKLRIVNPEEELKKIKLENESKRAEEAEKRKADKLRHEKWIRQITENLSNEVVGYFMKERVDYYSFRMIIGISKAKTTFFDTRELSQTFVNHYNLIDYNDNDIFFKDLEEILESKGIRCLKEFNYASDFAPASDSFDFSFRII